MGLVNKIKQSCRNFATKTANPAKYYAEKAKKEGWQAIEITLWPSYVLTTGKLGSYSVCIRNKSGNERRQEIEVIPCPGRYKAQYNGKRIVINDEADLERITRLQAGIYIIKKLIPEADKAEIPTVPNRERVTEIIMDITEKLDEKYLA